jgi:hypothetical protein
MAELVRIAQRIRRYVQACLQGAIRVSTLYSFSVMTAPITTAATAGHPG